jgi:ankyrin repeat protein
VPPKTLRDSEIQKFLVDRVADVSPKTSTGHPPLPNVAAYGEHTIAIFLIEKGANVNNAKKKKHGETLLLCAARRGDAQLIERLLNKGAGIAITNNVDCPPLFKAVV